MTGSKVMIHKRYPQMPEDDEKATILAKLAKALS
jgi:hypothetical protein